MPRLARVEIKQPASVYDQCAHDDNEQKTPHDGGRGSVVSSSEFKSEDLRFDPMAEHVFLLSSPRINSRAELFVSDTPPSPLPPIRVYSTHPNVCARYISFIHLP